MKEIKILTGQRAVTAAGTPEQIKEAPEYLQSKVVSIEVRANADNTGNTYLTYEDQRATAATTGRILAPGEVWSCDVSGLKDCYLDLSKIWIDAATSGNGISYSCIEVQ